MSVALIAFGANLGQREAVFERAMQRLGELAAGAPRASGLYRSQPIGGPAGQSEFLNAAIRLETSLTPAQLLAQVQQIETALGRQRHERWDARTIDLDLLLYDEAVIARPELTVPHPRLAFRRFMAEPAAEIAPALRHPTLAMSLKELAVHLREAPPMVAIHAAEPKQAEHFALMLAAATGAQALPVGASELPPAVSAGRNELEAIEFLEQRAQEMSAWAERETGQPAIVPYWLAALRRQAADELQRDEDFGEQAVAGAVPPKLLVWIESPDLPFHQPPLLPAVRVNADLIPEAREEAAAAVLAMQTPIYRNE